MSKLSELFKSSYEKWKKISKGRKIAYGVSFAGIMAAIIYLTVSLSATKYAVLFSKLDASDANTVVQKLKDDKMSYKISGNSISVPEEMRDELRLELAPQITTGSKGWELFDESNNFGSTDTEMNIQYQRALQGELEKTIKSFPQVENARVALVLPEDSAFVKDSAPASASITLMMKSGKTLSEDQVKAIAALVSGSVKNLPAKNVQIIDNNMKLLTQGLYDDDNTNTTTATAKQHEMKKDYEKYLEDKVMEQLARPFNSSNVTVKINADLDFDAVQNVTTAVDPKGTPVSEKTVEENNGNSNTNISQGPVDNNMSNTTAANTGTSGTSTSKEHTTNYEVGKSETKTQKAPGSVKRITASVIINGNLDDALKSQITDIVASTIGYDTKRGDAITVEGIRFDDTNAQNAQKALQEMQSQEAQKNKMKLYTLIGGGAGAVILAVILLVMFRKKNKGTDELAAFEDMEAPKGIDVVIGDKEQKPQVEFKPIDFDAESNNEKVHVEKEIKRYATEKPDQVADIIKSWLSEDER